MLLFQVVLWGKNICLKFLLWTWKNAFEKSSQQKLQKDTKRIRNIRFNHLPKKASLPETVTAITLYVSVEPVNAGETDQFKVENRKNVTIRKSLIIQAPVIGHRILKEAKEWLYLKSG